MEIASEKSVRLPTFSGEQKDFQIWWMRFYAYAGVYGFASAAGQTRNPDLPSKESDTIDESTDVGKRQKVAKKANSVCMASLTMAFTTEQLMGMIYAAS
jgi:hypothetical protein